MAGSNKKNFKEKNKSKKFPGSALKGSHCKSDLKSSGEECGGYSGGGVEDTQKNKQNKKKKWIT